VSALAALGGVLAALGLLLAGIGAYGTREPVGARCWRRTRRLTARVGAGVRARRRLTIATGAGVAAWLYTGWPVAAPLAAAGVLGVPALFTGRSAVQRRIERLEAVADWTRRLAQLLGATGGVEQVLQASWRSCPPGIRPQVGTLVARLDARVPTEVALRGFAADLADQTADRVVAALLLATGKRGPGLAAVLTSLADNTAAEVAMRREVEADRATPRTTARWVTMITLGMAGGMLLFDRAYLAPFGSPVGQLALVLVGLIFGAGLWWMHHLATSKPPPRLLAQDGDPVLAAAGGPR
jgi:tight adherence protein B